MTRKNLVLCVLFPFVVSLLSAQELLVFGHLFAIHGKSLLFLITDPILLIASITVLCIGPSTRGKPLQEASFGAAENL